MREVSREPRDARDYKGIGRSSNSNVEKPSLLFKLPCSFCLGNVAFHRWQNALKASHYDHQARGQSLGFVKAHHSHVIHAGGQLGLGDRSPKLISQFLRFPVTDLNRRCNSLHWRGPIGIGGKQCVY